MGEDERAVQYAQAIRGRLQRIVGSGQLSAMDR